MRSDLPGDVWWKMNKHLWGYGTWRCVHKIKGLFSYYFMTKKVRGLADEFSHQRVGKTFGRGRTKEAGRGVAMEDARGSCGGCHDHID